MKKFISIVMCAVLLAGCGSKSSAEADNGETLRVHDGVIQYSDDAGNWYNLITVDELLTLKEMANKGTVIYSQEPAETAEAPAETPQETVQTENGPHTHYFGTQIASGASTCTKGGYVTYQCSCGETTTRQLAPLGHDYQLLWAADATCENGGYKTYKCSRCDAEYTDFYPQLTEGCAAPEAIEETEGTEGTETAEG